MHVHLEHTVIGISVFNEHHLIFICQKKNLLSQRDVQKNLNTYFHLITKSKKDEKHLR